MSALMTTRRDRDRRRAKRRPEAAQDSLFTAVATQAPVASPPAVAGSAPPTVAAPAPLNTGPDDETSTTASAHRHGPTLDDLVAGAWEGLLAGAPADCIACGEPLTPRHSAGAGVVGGRCGGCGTALA
jgi:hypothetical protein